jgi:2-polyprenyl-6-methoxyphenol hydroxylase-like FAD-dependent oxidoreductase
MVESADYEVIIAGGGPVGTGLAIELGQRGIRVLVIERYPEPQPIPKGQNLTQRTMETFQSWGCEAELRAARPIPADVGIGGITLYRHLLSDYHYDWLNRSSVNAFYRTPNERLPQYETERVLRDRAAQIDTIDIRYGWSVERVTDTGDQVEVVATKTDGSETQTLTASYVVGCDGSRSVVRKTGNIPQKMSDHGRLMVLLVFRSMELHNLLKRYPGKAFFNVLHPDQGGYWQFFGRVDVGSWFFHAVVPPGTTEDFDFEGMLHDIVGQPFALDIDRIGFWDLRVAIADRYRSGRVFMAGDAAHSHPPYGGYGINTGFEDARNLGWKLAARLRGWGSDDLLDSYDSERRPVFESTARDFIENFIEDDNRFLQTFDPARDCAAFEAAWYDRNKGAEEVAKFEPNYEGSPIVCGSSGTPSARGDHRFEARAGHHLAPQPLANGSNAFDLLGSGFSLLSFGGDQASIASIVEAATEASVPLTVVENPSETHYGSSLILVRPDQFVAWVGDTCTDAAAVLRTVSGVA